MMRRAPGSLASLRVRYLARRALALSPSKLVALARLAQKISPRSIPRLICSMLWSAARYDVAFQDYVDWDMHLLTGRERATFMTHPKSDHYVRALNPVPYRRPFQDKIEFLRAFHEFADRPWLDVTAADAEEIRDFVTRHVNVVAKVPVSEGGRGVSVHRVEAIDDWNAFRSDLLARGQTLLESWLLQDPAMASLNPSSVNTLRLITMRRDGETHLLAAVLKAGNGGPIDNFSAGGMYTMLDEQGVARYGAFDRMNDTFTVHPATGVPIVGFRVPRFAEAVALVERATLVVPQIPYVGWDVAITPTRPVIIEGNCNTGVFQSKPSLSGVREGLLPRYQAVIGF